MALLAPATAGADAEIFGGEEVTSCGWPSAVWVDACTGTLVHPELVIFAAHCIAINGMPQSVSFGETIDAPTGEVPIASCALNPGFDLNNPIDPGGDYAYCTLTQPITDVPRVPILMGCEADQLVPGKEVTLVGYGHSNNGNPNFGVKREVVTTVNEFMGVSEVSIGGGGLGACFGDSGGPAYIQLDDGTWRVFGIVSRGLSGDCANTVTIYGVMHLEAVGWVEEHSGIDVTPCHTAEGEWEPGPECGGFPLFPGEGGGDWGQGCATDDVEGLSDHCGPPYEDPDATTGTGTGTDTDATGTDTDATGTDSDGGTGDTTAGPGTGTTGSDATGDDTGDVGTGGDGTETSMDSDGSGGVSISCSCTSDGGGEGLPIVALWVIAGLALRRRR